MREGHQGPELWGQPRDSTTPLVRPTEGFFLWPCQLSEQTPRLEKLLHAPSTAEWGDALQTYADFLFNPTWTCDLKLAEDERELLPDTWRQLPQKHVRFPVRSVVNKILDTFGGLLLPHSQQCLSLTSPQPPYHSSTTQTSFYCWIFRQVLFLCFASNIKRICSHSLFLCFPVLSIFLNILGSCWEQ